MKLLKWINGLLGLLSVLIVAGVYQFAHVCTSMEGMKPPCHVTRTWSVILGISLAVISIILIFIKNSIIRNVLLGIRFIFSLAIVLLPDIIAPVCKMKTMHCYLYTRPFLILIGVLLISFELVHFLMAKYLVKGGKHGALS
ncbi:DUF4418 family protein [[Clostridium] polysaccharolyticum]|uniref:DUF4418 domain-containing protein n=1 Tax=[Clostridium] polysaccharolyticum TaxID=29364 RepID=A0A1I0AAW1_9FIRM|nr:DUF4418 family protein [[Clostridium] polysaccharolyticum]SES91163.1 protein of unknown function [[Clostridium] polysaccharolyticum]